MGIVDQFGTELLRWHLAREEGIPYTEVQLDDFPFLQWRYEYKRNRNKKLDKPYVDPTFPTKSLADVLAADYYRYVVEILRSETPMNLHEEVTRIGHMPILEMRLGGRWMSAPDSFAEGHPLNALKRDISSYGQWHIIVSQVPR